MTIQGIHPHDNDQLGDGISLEATAHVVGRVVLGWLHEQVQVSRESRRVLFKPILSRPVCVAGEENDAAAVGCKTTEESEDEGGVSEMVDLKGLFVPVCREVWGASEIPIVGIADDASERGKFSIRNLRRDGIGEFFDGGEVGEIELADGSLSVWKLGKDVMEVLGVDVCSGRVSNSQYESIGGGFG